MVPNLGLARDKAFYQPVRKERRWVEQNKTFKSRFGISLKFRHNTAWY